MKFDISYTKNNFIWFWKTIDLKYNNKIRSKVTPHTFHQCMCRFDNFCFHTLLSIQTIYIRYFHVIIIIKYVNQRFWTLHASIIFLDCLNKTHISHIHKYLEFDLDDDDAYQCEDYQVRLTQFVVIYLCKYALKGCEILRVFVWKKRNHKIM